MNIKNFLALVFSISIFSGYAQTTSLELHLSFNQPKYVSGDTAFFRGLLLKTYDHKPVKGKKGISFMLRGSDRKIHFHNRVACQDGLTSNQCAL